MTERVQKALARAGLGSRRQADRWVAEGRVTVNGVTAEPGTRVGPGDEVRLDGRAVELDAGDLPTRVLAYYKPEGEVCTRSDPQGRPTIFDRLPEPAIGRWIQVGRLDLNSAGLILLTTDGHLAEALMHPSRQIEREYVARVRGTPSPATRERLLQGLDLEDGPARFTRVEKRPARGRHASLAVTLTEGRKREVRRLLETAGHPVSRLLRVRFGPVHLPRDLEPGEYRELEPDEVAGLRRAAGLNPEPEQGQP
mgnify:CR=1 FL=1